MSKKQSILDELNKEAGFKLPDSYFDDFASRLMEKLPEKKIVPIPKSTTWQRVRTYVYMAAMFIGIACMVKVFSPLLDQYRHAAETVKVTDEMLDDYLFLTNVDEYSLYEYLCPAEENVTKTNVR